MINTNKFLSRNSTPTLSTRSILGLGIIRSDSKKIDNLLKERLVLSKVRYGIERQRLERERRRNRETSLENDADQNYEISDFSKDNSKRRDGKPKRGLGFFMGTVLRTVVSSIGGLAFAAIPRFNLINDKVIKSGTNFNKTIGGTGGLLNSIKSQRGPFDKLRKIDLKPVRNIGKTITGFGNSLQFFVTSAIAGQVGGRAISALRTPAQAKAQIAQSAKRQKIRSKVVATETAREIAITERQQRVITKKQVSRNKFLFNEQQKVAARSVARESEAAGTAIDPSQRDFTSRNRMGDPIFEDITQELTPERRAFRYGKMFNQIEVRGDDVEFVGNEVFLNRKYSKTPKPVLALEKVNLGGQDFYYMSEVDSARLIEDRARRSLERKSNERFVKEFQKQQLQKPIGPFSVINTPEARARRFKQSFGKPTGADPFTGKGTYQITPTITSFDPETGVTTQTLTKGREFDPITGEIKAKKRAIKASKVTGKKGLKKFLKPVRKFLGETIGAIPFIGDLIGFLLDIFVFGEPPGRAAFMAIGGILGGFLGGLAGSIGGPPGIFLGGLIGGIGGDLLGGAFYNLLFGGGQSGFGERAPKSILKSGVKAGLATGGIATFGKYMLGEEGPEMVIDADSTKKIEEVAPGFLAALNDADAGEVPDVLRTYASYEGPAGRERIVPVPIPQKEEVGSQQIMIIESPSSTASSPFTQHYRRG